MVQAVLWIVIALVAISVLSTVLKLGFWLIGVAMFALWVYSLVDIVFLSGQSLLQKAIWAAVVTFFPTVGTLIWLAVKPANQRMLS